MKASSHNQLYTAIAVFLISLLAIAYIGPFFAPFEFDESENIIDIMTDEGRLILFSPLAPSARHPMGTDIFGYDLLTSMLYGAKYTILTMLLTAFTRVVGGFLIGYGQALDGKNRKQSFSVVQGLPIFVIIYFIMFGFIINPAVPPPVITAIQIGLFSIFGLPSTIPVFREKISQQLKTSYIEAARSSGGGRMWILHRHLLPHLSEDTCLLFMHEIIATLTLIGQLGIFSLFIGGTRLTTDPPELSSFTREWGGLIGQHMGKVGTTQWWLIVFPLAAYLLLFFFSYLFTNFIEKRSRQTFFKASNL